MKELRESIEKILDSVGALATEFDENARGFWIKYKTPEVTDQILALLEKEIRKARIDELKRFDNVTTPPFFRQHIKVRIKQLEKGKE